MPSRNVRPRLLGGTLAGALLLSSCMSGGGNQTDATAQRGGKAEVRVASAETDAKAMAALTAAGKAYEAKTGTKVTFEAIPLSDIYTKVNAASGTNAEYDAFLTGFIGHISLFQGAGKLVPVDDLIQNLGGKANFYDGQILFPIEGKTWWIPFDYNIAFGFIRKDWLSKAGLAVPTTWDQMLEVARGLQKSGDGRYGLMMPLKADGATNWITSQVMWANNVRIFDDKWKVVLDSPETLPKAVESLNFLKELSKFMPPGAGNASYAETVEAFASGQVGMSFYSGRMYDSMLKQDPEGAKGVEAFGFPMKSGEGTTASLGYDGVGILKTADSAETKKFVQWFFEEKLLDLYATAPHHYLPAQKSVFESEKWRALPTLKESWDRIEAKQEKFITNPNLHSIDTDGPGVDKRSAEVFQQLVFPKMFQRVVLNGEDPTTVVKEAAADIRKIAGG